MKDILFGAVVPIVFSWLVFCIIIVSGPGTGVTLERILFGGIILIATQTALQLLWFRYWRGDGNAS